MGGGSILEGIRGKWDIVIDTKIVETGRKH